MNSSASPRLAWAVEQIDVQPKLKPGEFSGTGLGGALVVGTIGAGRTRVVLDLKPGTYTYLCSTGGYWRTQHGTLVVR